MRRYFDEIVGAEMLFARRGGGDRCGADCGDTLQNIEVREI